jgi:hypothetical protein
MILLALFEVKMRNIYTLVAYFWTVSQSVYLISQFEHTL